ncbi:MAG: 4Fe-4S binding protein [Clostridiales bacterium]|nr:4Fe-4S binding protein [Clostridiales bacterium]
MDKIKNFFKSVGNWFRTHVPTRRRIIQLYAALLTNAKLTGYSEGFIYQNTDKITAYTKNICTPGLNCYSCPGAVAACPLGSLQNSLGSSNTTTPFYILGTLALFGLLLARTICGFLCPFGFFQDMLYKVKTPKVKKSAYTRVLSYLKYVLLITLVIAVPLIYHNVPGFCKYICPAGTFGGGVGLLQNSVNAEKYGMLGYLFTWKFVLMVICIVACIFIYRAFCRFICPLGAIYGFFNKISLLGVKLEKSKCIDCGMCISKCKMDIKHVGDHECINCGECISVCPTKAISWKGSKLFVEPTAAAVTVSAADVAEAPALNTILASGTTLQATGGSAVATDAEPKAQSNDTVIVEPKIAETPVEERTPTEETCETPVKKPKKAMSKRKKTRLILEIVAWSLAGILMIGALVYYNTLPPMAGTGGKKIENFKAATYQTADYDAGEEFDFYEYYSENYGYDNYLPDHKALILVFWSIKNETSKQYLTQLSEMYADIQTEENYPANIIAVHISDARITSEEVQDVIDENEVWKNSGIPFIQDIEKTDERSTLYVECGGSGAYPTLAFLNEHIRLHSTHTDTMTKESISDAVKACLDDTSYTKFDKGDKIFDFTVDTFESSYKDGTFSAKSGEGKIFVINFWYTSCGPCVAELPFFEDLYKEYGDKVVMIALHSWNGEQIIAQNFINNKGWSDWNMIFGVDKNDSIYRKLAISNGAYPETIVVDANGYIVFAASGAVQNGEGVRLLQDAIEAELAKMN